MKYPVGFWNYPNINTMTLDDVKLWVDCGMTTNMSPDGLGTANSSGFSTRPTTRISSISPPNPKNPPPEAN